MELRPLRSLAFLAVMLAVSHAALTPELYWKSMLPGTPMPKAVAGLLRPGLEESKQVGVAVGKGGVNVDAGRGKPGSGTNVNVGKGRGVGVSTGGASGRTNVGVGKGGVTVNTGHKRKPVYVHVRPGPDPFVYRYAATETQIHGDPNVALFFLEKDLKSGKAVNLHFVQTSNGATFLPRQLAESTPFSSSKLPEILNRFGVKPESEEAKVLKNTISECESSGIKGEEKTCATSLESMIDFSVSKLGKDIKAISTEVEKHTEMQEYRIGTQVRKLGSGSKLVACHKQSYPYAVFYCHETEKTDAYSVPLEGLDGTKAKAVAVCHKDTSEWNPKHLAFQVLKVKPGTVPVCHFLPEDSIVWFRN